MAPSGCLRREQTDGEERSEPLQPDRQPAAERAAEQADGASLQPARPEGRECGGLGRDATQPAARSHLEAA